MHVNIVSFFSLEEGGQTALGPALLVATTIAGKVSGSKVLFYCILHSLQDNMHARSITLFRLRLIWD